MCAGQESEKPRSSRKSLNKQGLKKEGKGRIESNSLTMAGTKRPTMLEGFRGCVVGGCPVHSSDELLWTDISQIRRNRRRSNRQVFA